jgi:ABC-2 type transport system permease protein
MSKVLLILRHELLVALGRRSFLLVTFGVPLLVILVMGGLSLVDDDSDRSVAASAESRSKGSSTEGYVDRSGLIQAIPRTVLRGHLLPYADEAQAQEALASGRIAAYYVIPEDYLERGELFYVYPDARPLTADGQEWKMVTTLFFNLVGGDEDLAERVWNPLDLEVFDLGTEPRQGSTSSSLWTRFFPALMAALFFATFMIGSTLLSESVAAEKENRTIEVLMLSASPLQIFAGKVAGLGAAALLRTFVWMGAVFAALRIGGLRLGLPAGSLFPPSLLAWGLVFFLLGFALYGSLMAGAGALVSRLKEVGQVTYLILSPLLVGYLVGLLAPLADASQRGLPVFCSLFPLTSPIVMMMRLSAGPVPLWHLVASIGLLATTAYLVLRAIAAMFRAQILLSGQPFSVRRFLSAAVR